MRTRLAGLGLVVSAHLGVCQTTLTEAVHQAGQRYAGVQVSLEQAAAAAAGVQQARTLYLPKGEFLAQVNRATRNNVFGMLMPNPVIAPISGPPLATNAGTNVWGTATGFLVSWEPFDLGQRKAQVASADANRTFAERAFARTRFEVEATAADAYLTCLAAEQLVKSAQSGVQRALALERVAEALASSGLKPGADAARARAERAAAEGQRVRAEEALRVARATLAQYAGQEVQTTPGPMLGASPPAGLEPANQAHPAVAEQRAAVEAALSRRKELDNAWAPRFQIQSALYARGTGANPDGTTGGGASGLGPNIYNWGVGFSVTFPIFDLPSIRARKAEESHRAAAESSRLKQVDQDLAAQRERAAAALESARRIMEITPVQLAAAHAAHEQANARYRAGLATVVEVADAQRMLAQSEIDDSLSRLNVWRAQLQVAVAAGDLEPLLAAASR